MMARLLTEADAKAAYALYADLTRGGALGPPAQFMRILAHPGTMVLGCDIDGRLNAMTTLHVLPNMTYGGRPYGLLENVVVAAALRGQGVGRAVVQGAIDQALAAGCYKIMLLTGQARGAAGFYRALGFRDDDKHCFVMRAENT